MTINWVVATPGALVVLWATRQLWGGWRSRCWPEVRGQVETAEIGEHVNYRGGWIYVPGVRYHYRAQGVLHLGTRLRFGAPWWPTSYSAADADLGAAELGADVVVYYNPKNPADAVLRPGIPWGVLVGVIVGVGLLWGSMQS
jgi:hypothetical protein